MTTQKIVPLGKKVLIKDKQPSQYYPGTTIIKQNTQKEYLAEVMAVGEEVETLEVGDIVKYHEHATGISMKHDGEDCQLLNLDMIFAKVVDA
jgi:co-chaperonin GroES (HSP10)